MSGDIRRDLRVCLVAQIRRGIALLFRHLSSRTPWRSEAEMWTTADLDAIPELAGASICSPSYFRLTAAYKIGQLLLLKMLPSCVTRLGASLPVFTYAI